MAILQQLSIAGFKSIRNLERLEFGPLNVLIGANGAGKSNLISFLRLLNFAMTGALGEYVGRAGGASSLLYFGAQRTPQMSATLRFQTDNGTDSYMLRLAHAAGDSLLFTDETVERHAKGSLKSKTVALGAGHKDSALNDKDQQADSTVKVVRTLLAGVRVYQFHDTSATALLRN